MRAGTLNHEYYGKLDFDLVVCGATHTDLVNMTDDDKGLDRRQLASDCADLIEGRAKDQRDFACNDRVNHFVAFCFRDKIAPAMAIDLDLLNQTRFEVQRQFDVFFIRFIYEHSVDGVAPNDSDLEWAMDSFLEIKMSNPSKAPISIVGDQVVVCSNEEFLRRLNQRTIQERLSDINEFLASKSANNQPDLASIIFSIDHADSPWADVSTSINEANLLISQGIQISLVIGAYREEGGKVSEEISFRCFYRNDFQKGLIFQMAYEATQQSVLQIEKSGATYICYPKVEPIFIGSWGKIAPMNPNDLEVGKGFSIIKGEYYMATNDTKVKAS